jgi:hypothetical protein
MIVCHRHHLEQRATQRGYTLDEVMPCVVAQDGDQWTIDTEHPAYPRPKPGLGDMVAAGLSAVGITKERVSKLVGGDCGCAKRQEALNELGRRVGIGR